MNKLLVGIIAATIIGSMAFMQPTNALASAPCPPYMGDLCHQILHQGFMQEECPMCGYHDLNPTTLPVDDYLVIIDARIFNVNQEIDALGDDISNGIVIDIVIIGLLVSVLAIGAANLAKRK